MKRVLSLLLVLALPALAQVRTIPQDAKRGEMRYIEDMTVEVNGKRHPLAPGVQIRDTLNMIIVPAALPGNSLVKYRADDEGTVRQVWILTPEEAGPQQKEPEEKRPE